MDNRQVIIDVLKGVEGELAQDAGLNILEQELNEARERAAERIEANKADLKRKGEILRLQRELGKATEEHEAFLSDRRELLTPLGRIKSKELGRKVSDLSQKIVDLEKEPEGPSYFGKSNIKVR